MAIKDTEVGYVGTRLGQLESDVVLCLPHGYNIFILRFFRD
jgi:hypothetical protein